MRYLELHYDIPKLKERTLRKRGFFIGQQVYFVLILRVCWLRLCTLQLSSHDHLDKRACEIEECEEICEIRGQLSHKLAAQYDPKANREVAVNRIKFEVKRILGTFG